MLGYVGRRAMSQAKVHARATGLQHVFDGGTAGRRETLPR